MKTLTLPENQSKVSRILIAANKLALDKFIKAQESECKTVGALMELGIMKRCAELLNVPWVGSMELSKYRPFLENIWVAAKAVKIEVDSEVTAN